MPFEDLKLEIEIEFRQLEIVNAEVSMLLLDTINRAATPRETYAASACLKINFQLFSFSTILTMSDVVIKIENLSKEYRYGAVSQEYLFRDLQTRWAEKAVERLIKNK